MNVLNRKWCIRFLNLARIISTWSKDNSTKVGAVITSSDGDPISFGFNGFPRGVSEFPERNERPDKYDFSEHAERNSIYLSRRDLRGTIMYTTCFPCPDCARAIVQSGVSVLVVDRDYMQTINENSSIGSPDFKRKTQNSLAILTEGLVSIIETYSANDIQENNYD